MNLKEFLDMLSDIELSQLSFGSRDATGKIVKQDALIRIINRGVTELHNKFLLSKGELLLDIKDRMGYRVNIKDESHLLSADEVNRIHKVLQIFNPCGIDLDFNKTDRHSCCDVESVYMTNKDTLVFNRCCGVYRIIFQYSPKLIIIKEDYNWDKEIIDLPIEFSNALVYYVTMNLHAINPSKQEYTNAVSPSINYARKYAQEIKELKELNVEIDGLGNNTQKFRDSSFI